MANKLQKNYAHDEDFPKLEKHNNWMAKVLTKEMYQKLRDKETPSGFTFDAVIQTGRSFRVELEGQVVVETGGYFQG